MCWWREVSINHLQRTLKCDTMTSGQVAVKGDVLVAGDAVHSDRTQASLSPTKTEHSELANLMKEKTPMCLVNELARFNKLQHQYRLTSEQGPAHKKLFTVTLKLGDEEYSAEGASIKKAQHLAANIALKSTSYKNPPSKSSRNHRIGKNNITPTVELNALAMKRGEPTVYTFVEVPMFTYPSHNYAYRGVYPQQRLYGSKPPSLYKVNVKVGEREFHGEGLTAQAARHDAAAQALEELRNLPDIVNCNLSSTDSNTVSIEAGSASELKSPISLVHELSLKRNLSVTFNVISEKGPPHMRIFVTSCCVGDDFETLGEGNGKKASKKRAAEKMLDQLKLLPPNTTVTASSCHSSLRMKKRTTSTKKKSRNLVKITCSSPNKENNAENTDPTIETNPISRLMQLQQAKKEKEPVYTLLEERSQTKRREFLMEVKIGEQTFVGSGPNKKIAKRNAADGLLQRLGYSSGGYVKNRLASAEINREVITKADNSSVGGSGGRQLVPGLLLVSDGNNFNHHHCRPPPTGHVNVQATAAMAKDFLIGANSKDVDALNDGKNTSAVSPKDQLLYLAQLLGFRVQFSDFPKGNHSEYLSLVSLSTDPPQVCHGSGLTTDLSRDQAALTALRVLSELGLDSVTPMKKEPITILTNNDGIYGGKPNSTMKTNYVNGGAAK